MNREVKKNKLGFGTQDLVETVEEKVIDSKALVKQGMIPELVGRLPIVVQLNDLTVEDLKRILVEPENSIVKQYQDLVSLDGVVLSFTDEALDFIANKSFENKTGARGLKTIIEGFMNDLMFEIPDESYTEVCIVVKDNELSYDIKSNKLA